MEDSIFTKMVKGEIACHKIYEDEHTMAFLDLYPKGGGHTLVISKKQVEFIWDLDEELYKTLLLNCKKIALHLRTVMGTKYVHMGVIGTEVPHAHIHLIPFNDSEELRFEEENTRKADEEELKNLAQKLRI